MHARQIGKHAESAEILASDPFVSTKHKTISKMSGLGCFAANRGHFGLSAQRSPAPLTCEHPKHVARNAFLSQCLSKIVR